MACSYAIRIGVAAWRRKVTILVAIALLLILGFGFEYNRSGTLTNTKDHVILTKSEMPLSLTLATVHHRRQPDINVQFVDKKTGPLKQTYAEAKNTDEFVKMLDAATIAKLEQPSRDDIAIRQMYRFNQDNDLEPQTDEMGIPYANINAAKPYIPAQRLVHFDLKGAPPKMSYLKRLFPLLKTMGATGILMEYEDMFPFTGSLHGIASRNAYTKAEISELMQVAKELKLDVIPLVQTFGHMEFALKHEKFISIREIPDSPQALCPSRNQSLVLIRELIAQIMELHNDVKYLHIGCDEVFQMGECEKCREIMRETLFLQHVKTVVGIVREKWPHLKIIIWDDMLRHISQQSLEEMGIGKLVQPMVWVYVEQIYRFVQTQVWEKYAAVFPTIWAASAFKGAYGETLYVPNAKRHLANNLRWMEVMAEQSINFKNGFEGIVITGWQRYDHFSVLCELLPAAFPSLALCLIATTHGYFNESLRAPLLSALSCPQYQSSSSRSFIALDSDPFLWDKFSRCMFPGSPFFKLTYRLHSAETEANEYIESIQHNKGWMTDYNVRRNYTLPLRVEELMTEFPRVYHTITSLARSANDAMNDVFDLYTVAEWVEQRIYPYIQILEAIQNQSIALKSKKVWSQRPLPPLRDLQRFGVPMPYIG